VFGGNWTARNGVLGTMPASANGAKALAMATGSPISSTRPMSRSFLGQCRFAFPRQQAGYRCRCLLRLLCRHQCRGSDLEFGYANNGWHSITNVPMTFAANTAYHLKVQAQGSRLRIYVTNTNQPLIDVRAGNFSSGMVGVRDYCTDGDKSISGFAHPVVRELAALPAGSP